MTARARDRWIIGVGVVLLGLTVALGAAGLAMPETTPPCPFVKPILCAELPGTGAVYAQTLSPAFNPASAWRSVVWLDMPFLVAYAALLVLGARALVPTRSAPGRGLLRPTTVLLLLGAALDVAENNSILAALDHVEAGVAPTDIMALVTTGVARGKFAALGLGCLLLGMLALRAAAPRWMRVAYAAAGALAAVGVGGVLAAPAIELGGLGIALCCALVLGHAVARQVRRRRPGTPGAGGP